MGNCCGPRTNRIRTATQVPVPPPSVAHETAQVPGTPFRYRYGRSELPPTPSHIDEYDLVVCDSRRREMDVVASFYTNMYDYEYDMHANQESEDAYCIDYLPGTVTSLEHHGNRSLWVPSTPYSSANFIITNKASTIKWEGYGLKIHVPDDSIPLNLTTARLDVSVHGFTESGDNQALCTSWLSCDDYANPVSALYSLRVGSGKLCRPITTEIQHGSNIFQGSHLKILRAGSENENFQPVKGTAFNCGTNYGRVTVPESIAGENPEYDDFSWFIVVLRRVFFPNTIHYKAQVYISKPTLKMHFIVTMAIDLCTTVSKRNSLYICLQTSIIATYTTCDHDYVILTLKLYLSLRIFPLRDWPS